MGGWCMKKLNMAMVGCGTSGNDFALVSRLIPYVHFTAACDLNETNLKKFARKNRISAVFSDYEELLTLKDIDAVCLATPHDLHYEMILAAVRAGKHILVEKPVTRTYQEAQDLIKQIDGVKVGVNFQFRYDAGCFAMARAVQVGALGEIHSVRINVPWHRELSYFDASSWHKTIGRSGGGTLITQASHFLDVVLWALGEKPTFAYGVTKTRQFDVEVDTLTHAIVETEAETLISMTTSMVTSSEQSAGIEVYGMRGTAIYFMKPIPSVKFKDVRVKKERPPVWGVHAYQRSLASFARWILNDEPYLIPVEESVTVLSVIDAIYRSAISGKREAVHLTAL
jgi:predicted dehydrogenase